MITLFSTILNLFKKDFKIVLIIGGNNITTNIMAKLRIYYFSKSFLFLVLFNGVDF